MENIIYLVVEHYTYDMQLDDIKTTAFKDKEKAIEYFHNQIEEEKNNTWINSMPNVIETLDETDDEPYYEAYVDGCAMEFDTTIYVTKLEIH